MELSQLEQLAETVYTSSDSNIRINAELTLRTLYNNVSFIPQCQVILDNSNNQYALHLASISLIKLFTIYNSTFNKEQVIEIRNYILNYLAVKINQNVPNYIIKSLIQFVCRITKICWNDDQNHRDIVIEITKLFQHSSKHMILAMQILNELIIEMNTNSVGQNTSVVRKVAVSFRDLSLLSIFQLSINTIKQIQLNQVSFNNETDSNNLKTTSLNVIIQCLSFDFIGTNADDLTDEIGTIQVPSSWRVQFEDFSMIQLFFDMCLKGTPEVSALSMQVLVQCASVRRSLFSQDDKRIQYLVQIITGTVGLLEQGNNALSNSNTYAQFCRLLSRVKANYQLSELVKMDIYSKWINLVATFTMDSFKNYEWAENGLYFLLGLWARLTVSIPFMKGDIPNFLNTLVPNIFKTFITVRIGSLGNILNEGNIEDVFGDLNLEEQGRHIPTLARLSYSEAAEFVKSIYDPVVMSYQQMVQNLNSMTNKDQLTLLEAQLAFLVYVISSLISAQALPGTNPEEQEALDADLISRVFQLLKVVDYRQINQPNFPVFSNLDRAIVKFFQEFRRLHVGTFDSSSRGIGLNSSVMDSNDIIFDEHGIVEMDSKKLGLKDAPIYTLLRQHLGACDQLSILNIILQKIVQNLKYYGVPTSNNSNNNLLVEESLALLNELSSGYNSSKMLMLMPSVKSLLTSHGSVHFPFIMIEANYKARTTFYCTLGRLVFSDSNVDLFEPFMEVFEQTINQIQQNDPRSEVARALFIGLCRDLRGVCLASVNKKNYNLLFEWIYPKHIGLFHRMVSSCWDFPNVIIPFLRFLNEFTYNKSQRIIFDPTSPNGLLLFRESSKLLQEFGEPLLNACISNPTEAVFTSEASRDLYKTRYKSMSLTMTLLQHLLSGGYVPLGVFALYDDKSLTVAIDLIIKMIVYMRDSIETYPKIIKSYHSLLEVLFRNHSPLLVELDAQIFNLLINGLHDGLSNMDSTLSSLAATSLDHIFTHAYKLSRKRDTSSSYQLLAKRFTDLRDLLQSIMNTLFNLVLFDQVGHHWALARPMFSLILIDEAVFINYKQQLASTQTIENQGRLSQSFSELMEGVQGTLDTKNRDKFSQNLSSFRIAASKYLVRPNL